MTSFVFGPLIGLIIVIACAAWRPEWLNRLAVRWLPSADNLDGAGIFRNGFEPVAP